MTTDASTRGTDPTLSPPVLADHPALDFLNTVVQVNGQCIDHLTSDAGVREALRALAMDVPQSKPLAAREPGQLQARATVLREAVRALVRARKTGERPAAADLAELNRVLGRGLGRVQLHWQNSAPQLQRERPAECVDDVLLPFAESAAELLDRGDYARIRPCENPACSLWFYDRSKTNRRRWCSMALCGNRAKVAAYRARQRGE
jgi:predicted RNA-binding Zn ribbon-like protein